MLLRLTAVCASLVLVSSCGKATAPPAPPTPAAATAAVSDRSKLSHELQEKCARDAHESYKHRWEEGFREPGLVSDYTNHYNAKMGKCFMLVQIDIIAKIDKDTNHNKRLVDVLENREIGVVQWFTGKALTCEVHGQACKSTDEWDALVKPYMED